MVKFVLIGSGTGTILGSTRHPCHSRIMVVGIDRSSAPRIFDRRAVRRHRDRAAPRLADFDYLLRDVAARLADRLADINRTFPCAVELGSRAGILRDAVSESGKVATLMECGLSATHGRGQRPDIVADEEYLSFADGSVDLVLSNLSLHWTNDLPGALIQIRRALKPDGLFLASMLGGDTLVELRRVLIDAETAMTGGASPRISPFADLGDAAALLQRTGFALPVADMDTLTVTYADAFALMHDLRGMGESNAVADRPLNFTRRSVLFDAAARYTDLYGGADGRIPATFQILFLAGWAPHAIQQKPLRPGSAEARLADALGTEELSAGEKTRGADS